MPAIERYRSLGSPMIGQTFDAVEALAGMERVQEGHALLARGDEVPAMMRRPWAIVAAARGRGLLAAAEGDLATAEAMLEEAVDAGETAGNPLELGRSLLALGTVQRRAREKQAARRTLGRAIEILEQLGARLWTERARRELDRIGGRSSPRTCSLGDRDRDRRARLRGPLEQGGGADPPSEPEDGRVEPVEDLPQGRRALPDRARRRSNRSGAERVSPGIPPVVAGAAQS